MGDAHDVGEPDKDDVDSNTPSCQLSWYRLNKSKFGLKLLNGLN